MRIYKYIIFNQVSAPIIEKKRGWHVRNPLDIEIMKKGSFQFSKNTVENLLLMMTT